MYYGPDMMGKWGYVFQLAKPPVNGSQDFVISDAEQALHRMTRLQTQGFGVPDHAIERLKMDVADTYRT
jgi:hypothetical protein